MQRYQCNRCGKTFSDKQPLDGLRVDFKQACNVAHLLCEGMGIRAIERFTGLHRDTVLSILEMAGEKCARLLDKKVRNLTCRFVQVDEVHGFVFSKPQNTKIGDPEHGEQFTYLGMDMTGLSFGELCHESSRQCTEESSQWKLPELQKTNRTCKCPSASQ